MTNNYDSVFIYVEVSLDSTINTALDLRFNIENNDENIKVNNISLISIEPQGCRIPLSNFIPVIKNGNNIESLNLKMNNLGIKLNKIQFVFETTKGDVTSNIINID